MPFTGQAGAAGALARRSITYAKPNNRHRASARAASARRIAAPGAPGEKTGLWFLVYGFWLFRFACATIHRLAVNQKPETKN
jgi:hypothetical protein